MKQVILKMYAALLLGSLTLSAGYSASEEVVETPEIPKIDAFAPDFSLQSLSGETFNLKKTVDQSATLLVVLRGYPGYQCPICSRQVADFIIKQEKFTEAGVKVVMVYPGPVEGLQELAEDFLENKNWPQHFEFLLDPDYKMVTQYGLRWDAPRETAYPSTFHISKGGKIVHQKVSKTHGGRVDAELALKWVHPE